MTVAAAISSPDPSTTPVARPSRVVMRATQDVAPLEHQRAHSGARQVGGGCMSVVAAADDDRVVALRHDPRTACGLPPLGRKVFRRAGQQMARSPG